MRIMIHPTLYAYILSMLLCTSWHTCIGSLISLVVHEAGHLLVCYLAGERCKRVVLTPFGGMIIYADGKSPSKGIKGICVAAAGPVANYLLLACMSSIGGYIGYRLSKAILTNCMAMILINLLPVFPLDGGRVILCLGYYLFPVTKLIVCLSHMGIATGVAFLFLAGYVWFSLGVLNCSMVIVGGYLIYAALQSKDQVLSENVYAVIQERADATKEIMAVRTYYVLPQMVLLKTIPLLFGNSICEFVFESNKREVRVTEKILHPLFLKNPLFTIEEAYLSLSRLAEKSNVV